MKLVQEFKNKIVTVVVYENTISHNPNPYYTVDVIIDGVTKPFTAGWSKELIIKDASDHFDYLTK